MRLPSYNIIAPREGYLQLISRAIYDIANANVVALKLQRGIFALLPFLFPSIIVRALLAPL